MIVNADKNISIKELIANKDKGSDPPFFNLTNSNYSDIKKPESNLIHEDRKN